MSYLGKRILIAEDDAVVAMMLADTLSDLGFKTTVVYTLSAAMDEARANPPNVALLDVNLSDGISLPVAHLLALRGIPSIFMTGDPASSYVAGLKADTVITKPFAPAELQAALDQAFSG